MECANRPLRYASLDQPRRGDPMRGTMRNMLPMPLRGSLSMSPRRPQVDGTLRSRSLGYGAPISTFPIARDRASIRFSILGSESSRPVCTERVPGSDAARSRKIRYSSATYIQHIFVDQRRVAFAYFLFDFVCEPSKVRRNLLGFGAAANHQSAFLLAVVFIEPDHKQIVYSAPRTRLDDEGDRCAAAFTCAVDERFALRWRQILNRSALWGRERRRWRRRLVKARWIRLTHYWVLSTAHAVAGPVVYIDKRSNMHYKIDCQVNLEMHARSPQTIGRFLFSCGGNGVR